MKLLVYCTKPMLSEAVLVPIKPECMCKILNGKKAVDVRKKVLKETLK